MRHAYIADIVRAVDQTHGRQQLRFLIVDDIKDIRYVMAHVIERAGHIAEEAADGVDAIEALSTQTYDVMLLDLLMPRMGGEEVLRWLDAHPARAEGLHIVVVSASAGENHATLEELGVSQVLPKPFRRQDLTELIADVTARVD